jgi:hypothetical protein
MLRGQRPADRCLASRAAQLSWLQAAADGLYGIGCFGAGAALQEPAASGFRWP